jgi:hypothetical protein
MNAANTTSRIYKPVFLFFLLLLRLSDVLAQDGLYVADEYSIVRASHLAICHEWRFNIDYLQKVTGYVWPIQTLDHGQMIKLHSLVRGYHNGNIVGTTIMFVLNSNLTYVISIGTETRSKTAILLVSQISNGEPKLTLNQTVDKIRTPNDNNLFLEEAGNENISLVIEDKMYIRSIYLLSDGIPLKLFHVGDYKIN